MKAPRPLRRSSPDRRSGTALEVAQIVVFLEIDEASDIHGITLPVEGGLLATPLAPEWTNPTT